jgi:intracellular sulfur oxidation DsrE/DsrF family protein
MVDNAAARLIHPTIPVRAVNQDDSGDDMKTLQRIPLVIAALFCLLAAGATLADEPIKVVYHLSEGLEKAPVMLRNVRNHLDADPTVKIVVVGQGPGIEFMLEGAQDKNGNPFVVAMESLNARGVEFRVCRNTLTARNVPESKVVLPATIVGSGMAEAARLQSKEGYVYLKP